MGKTRDLFKKTGYTKGTIHAKMGTMKDRNSKDLTTRRDVKNTQKNYTKKGLNGLDNHGGVVTHLKSDLLECEVKALGSIAMNKAGGGDGIPVDLFKILKDDSIKVL